MSLLLYSPVNFVVGLQLRLTQRSRLTLSQAVAEAQAEAPRWGYRVAAGITTGGLALLAVTAALPRVAAPAIQALTERVNRHRIVLGVGLLVAIGTAWLISRWVREGLRFYALTCQRGLEERQRRRK